MSDWLRPQPAEREDLQRKAESGIARGFVQVYEDAKGNPVIAVAYWKPGAEKPVAPKRPQPDAVAGPPDDHTDDLYFTRSDARLKRKKKAGDPNQLDMFGAGGASDDSGDAPGPGVVILDDESDATEDRSS